MQRLLKLTLLAGAILSAPVRAELVEQYASSVIGFSSQYSDDAWSARQALGAPDTFAYGDIRTAWAPARINDGPEFLTLGFERPVYASGVAVRETLGNGFVTGIDLLDTTGTYHPVWSGTDGTTQGRYADFVASWSRTSFLTQGVRIHVDTLHTPGWEEIDAVRLFGVAPAVPEPETWALSGIALAGVLLARRRQSRRR